MKGKEIKENQLNQLRIYFRKKRKKRKEKKQKEYKGREVAIAISKHSLLFYTPSAICLFDQVAT